ncbi:MAG: GTP 3',8-cyclase MoaA [Betaproteobacteria bacterium]|nr:GTP 3',8-cyclase MoaA [Betaproteobacteria bacterium]
MPISSSSHLIDRHGRRVSYLRLSVTDRCDFRCTYCMGEKMNFLPREEVLSLEECLRIARVFVRLGVSKIRITGGEPLVRRNLSWLLREIAALPGLSELVLTTNGSQLERFAQSLVEAGVKRVNVSLDTLKPERFREITRIGEIGQVLDGIAAARVAGFRRVKLNTVMMRGVNDDEFAALVHYALYHDLDITFIEEMPLGETGRDRPGSYMSGEEALALLGRDFPLIPSSETSGGPARYWRLPGANTRIGFISPLSHNFCETCNRVRVTARGELHPCLGQNEALPLMPLLRAHPEGEESDTLLLQAITESMGLRPKGHEFSYASPETPAPEKPQVLRFMSMTGG